MDSRILKNYAEVLVNIGVSLKKGENVLVEAPIEAYELVRYITDISYKIGSKYVKVDYFDDELSRIRLKECKEEYLDSFPQWQSQYLKSFIEKDVKIIYLRTVDLDLFKNCESKRAFLFQKGATGIKDAQRIRTGEISVDWAIAYYPTDSWAKAVYPELPAEEGLKKLWENVISINMLGAEDSCKAWDDHKKRISHNREIVEGYDIKTLHFKSDVTDFTLDIVDGACWTGGYYLNSDNEQIVPNIPTVEVFSTPSKYTVNGHVQTTLPLNYNNTIIKKIRLEFEKGKIVKWTAEEGQEALDELINTDAGTRYLGEVALVSSDCPIYQSKKIYYNTIYDENAVCHIAIGNAYASTVRGSGSMTKDEQDAIGINHSSKHVDIMIGSEQMNVTATLRNGETRKILRNGLWALNEN